MSDPNDSKELRALTYTEMMNSGRQDINADEDQHHNELERRLEALEKKVQYLEKVIQRQVRLGRMNDWWILKFSDLFSLSYLWLFFQ